VEYRWSVLAGYAAFRPRLKGGFGASVMEPYSGRLLSAFRLALTIPFHSLLPVANDYMHHFIDCQLFFEGGSPKAAALPLCASA